MGVSYGFRGVVGQDFNEMKIRKIAINAVNYLYTNNYSKRVIIATDNRPSAGYILSVLEGVFLRHGIDVNFLSVCTTPELAFLTKKFNFPLGVMITASHNSVGYNGVKFFNQFGEMLALPNGGLRCSIGSKNKYGKIINFEKTKELYFLQLKNKLNSNKIKCVFDCANGAAVGLVRKLFAGHKIIGADFSGNLINNECGSQHVSCLIAACKKHGKIGFAFDGDGDRVIAVDKTGEIVDGDKIAYILASHYLKPGGMVVGTKVSSLGLEISLKNMGVGLVRCDVGAINVVREMELQSAMIGCETCGHVFTNLAAVSDGVAVAIELLNILNRTGKSFKQLLQNYCQSFKMEKSIDLNDRNKNFVYEENSDQIRVVVRRSETENKLRIFVDGLDRGEVEKRFNQIIKQINQCESEVEYET